MNKYEDALTTFNEFKINYENSTNIEKLKGLSMEAKKKLLKKNPLCLYLDTIPKQYSIDNTRLIDNNHLIHSYNCSGINDIKPHLYFNCSIIHYNDGYLLVYRTDLRHEELKRFCVYINLHIVKLNKKYKVIGESKTLKLKTEPKSFLDKAIKHLPDGHHCEDPRWIIYKDRIFLFYTDGYKQLLAIINKETLNTMYCDYLDIPFNTSFEKNWTPLIKNDSLYLVYNYNPIFTIFKLDDSNPYVLESIIGTRHDILNNWKYGDIRGGTPWIKTHDNKYYISVFHSSNILCKLIDHSRVYVAGIILLDDNLKPCAISSIPLMRGEIESYTIDRLNKNIFVVFPSGLIYDEDKESYIISFGYNDHSCRILEVKKKEIYNNLIYAKDII